MANDIEEVKSRLDIVDVVSASVKLNRSGSNYKANCPFHNEKTASFMVNPQMQIYKCFGCGKAGDVINFIQEINKTDFKDALEISADMAGYKLNTTSKKSSDKKKIIALNTKALEAFEFNLHKTADGQEALSYLKDRGYGLREIHKFRIGFGGNNNSLVKKLIAEGYSGDDLVKFGIAVNRRDGIGDKFAGRVILPIISSRGEVLAFSGRKIKDDSYGPKYLNSPDNDAYHKGKIVMGLYQALEAIKNKKFVVVQEGNMDLLSSHAAGIENIVAIGGTAITIEQLALLNRFADTIVFSFDTDKAGKAALIKAIKLCEEKGLSHLAVDLKEYKDPDEMIQASADKWIQAVKDARNSFEFIEAELSRKYDLGQLAGRNNYYRKIKPVINIIKNPVTKKFIIEKVSAKLSITQSDIINEIDSISKDNNPEAISGIKPVKVSKLEKLLLAMLIQTKLFKEINLETNIFQEELCKSLWIKLTDIDEKEIRSSLNESELSLYEEAMFYDISNIEDLENEIVRTVTKLKKKLLEQEIMVLRSKLNGDPENNELEVLNNKISELKSL